MRTLIRSLAKLALAGSIAMATVAAGHAEDKVVRIGFQKYGTLILLKTKGLLEEKLKPHGLHGRVDRVPGRSAAARGAQCRLDRFRHDRRGAADLRAGRRSAARLCRLRAARTRGRGDSGAQGQPAEERRRPQGQERRAQQGLERPLSSGQGAGKGGRRLFRRANLVPAAGRCPRCVREGRGRRLGDLGTVPSRRPRQRPARASSSTATVWSTITSSISPRATSRMRIPTWSTPSSARSTRSIAGSRQTATTSPGSSRRRSAFPRMCSRSPCSASNMA